LGLHKGGGWHKGFQAVEYRETVEIKVCPMYGHSGFSAMYPLVDEHSSGPIFRMLNTDGLGRWMSGYKGWLDEPRIPLAKPLSKYLLYLVRLKM
jgi:hypothetical protein